MIYDMMSQNTGRAKALPDWFNRISIAGGLNTDLHWGNRSMGYMGENIARISVNDFYLNTTANVNDWVKAFGSLSFNNASGQFANAANPTTGTGLLTQTIPMPGQYSTAYPPGFNVEQAYLTFANYDEYPVFFQIGKQFTDFGRYQIHPLEYTLAQVLSESLQTSAKLGFITQSGFHGDIYSFDNPVRQVSNTHTKPVYGAALGYDQINDQLGFDVGVGYMSQMTGVNAVANSVFNGTYTHTVGAVNVYGDVNSGPFSIGARYTSAIQHFSPADLSTQLGIYNGTVSGARPWAADITAGYGFNGWNHNQNVYVGYQTSNNAVNLFIPKNRWLVGYGIEAWKYTDLGLEVGHDTAYSSGNGGSGENSNTIGARASVKFG
jgi:hypothetical protein